jgi:hypothetical protein
MEALPEGHELAEILVLSHLPDSRRRLKRQKHPRVHRNLQNRSMKNLSKSCPSLVRITRMKRGRCELRVKFCFGFCLRHPAQRAFST